MISGGEPSASIYASMLKSPAWKKLKPRAQILYLYMKMQYYGVKEKDKPERNPLYFVFNEGIWKKTYGLYTNNKSFYQDRDMLVKNGFIEIVETGKTTRTKNIYKFSDNWHDSSQKTFWLLQNCHKKYLKLITGL